MYVCMFMCVCVAFAPTRFAISESFHGLTDVDSFIFALCLSENSEEILDYLNGSGVDELALQPIAAVAPAAAVETFLCMLVVSQQLAKWHATPIYQCITTSKFPRVYINSNLCT